MDCASAPAGEYYVIARVEATWPWGPVAHRLDSPARHCDGELNRTRQHEWSGHSGPDRGIRGSFFPNLLFLLRLRLADSLCE